MTDEPNVFQVHYRDGRVEGPLSSQVVGDLIQAGVIQPDDMLSPPGGHPTPAAAHAAFAELFGELDDYDDAATAMMSIDQLSAGVGDDLADLADDWGEDDATIQMDTSLHGHMHAASDSLDEELGVTPTPLVPAPDLQPTASASISADNLETEIEDLFAVAQATPSGSNIPRKSASQSNKSYSSSSGAYPSSISVPNPFAKRGVKARPARSSGSYRRSRASASISGITTGVDALFRKSAQEIRQQLLDKTVPKILGVDAEASPDELEEGHRQRRVAVAQHDDVKNDSIMVRAALIDLISIFDLSLELMRDDKARGAYLAAGSPPFRKHVDFQYAPVRPIDPKWDPLETGISIEASTTEAADISTPAGADPTPEPQPQPGAASTSSGRVNPAMLQGRSARSSASHSGSPQRPRSRNKKPKPSPRKKKKKKKPVNERGQQRNERLKEFKGSQYQEEGDPFEGPLAFGVGKAARGIAHTLPVFALAFGACFALVTVGGMGEHEFELSTSETMIYARGGILAGFALLALFVIRRESPARLGWKPNLVATILAIPFAAFVAACAAFITPFPLQEGASLPVILGLIAIRGVAEPLFFQGFITRTLLIEFRDPMPPIFITALCYGIYTLSFLGIIEGSPLNVIYGVVVWGFGAGLPYSVIYWKTRSLFIVIVCQLIILLTVAFVSYQDLMAAAP